MTKYYVPDKVEKCEIEMATASGKILTIFVDSALLNFEANPLDESDLSVYDITMKCQGKVKWSKKRNIFEKIIFTIRKFFKESVK